MTRRTLARLGALLTAGGLVAVLGTGSAAAHVVADPPTAVGGGYSVITFRVPDESATAGTVRLAVTLPADHPITSARTEPIPGWTAQVQKEPLPAPIKDDDGDTITDAVRTVTWTAQPGVRINPGEFLEFRLSVGPLPDGPGRVVMPAVQTYDDGTAVSWTDPPQAPGQPEPEHPAPSITLTAADPALAAAPTDGTARWMGGAGLVLGALGAALGIVALGRSRRRDTPTPATDRETAEVS